MRLVAPAHVVSDEEDRGQFYEGRERTHRGSGGIAAADGGQGRHAHALNRPEVVDHPNFQFDRLLRIENELGRAGLPRTADLAVAGLPVGRTHTVGQLVLRDAHGHRVERGAGVLERCRVSCRLPVADLACVDRRLHHNGVRIRHEVRVDYLEWTARVLEENDDLQVAPDVPVNDEVSGDDNGVAWRRERDGRRRGYFPGRPGIGRRRLLDHHKLSLHVRIGNRCVRLELGSDGPAALTNVAVGGDDHGRGNAHSVENDGAVGVDNGRARADYFFHGVELGRRIGTYAIERVAGGASGELPGVTDVPVDADQSVGTVVFLQL